jgi:hypothetical protein
MRFLLQTLVIAALAYAAAPLLPFWGLAVAGAIGGFFFSGRDSRRRRPARRQYNWSFPAGLLAGFAAWALPAFRADRANHSLLSEKIFQIISPGLESPIGAAWTLILLTGLIAAITAGLGAYSGSLLGRLLKRRR